MIVKAQQKHLPNLLKIRNKVAFTPESQIDHFTMQQLGFSGFLNGLYSLEEFEADLDKVFYVWEENDEALGYVRIDEFPDIGFKELESKKEIEWLDKSFKELYFMEPHAELGAILVAEKLRGKGIAEKLLNKAIKDLKSKRLKYLFSFVVDSPLKNIPSIKFHLKQGFKPIAKLKLQEDLNGYKNYQSTLYVKEI